MLGWFLVLAVALLLGFHAIVLAYFVATEKWAKTLSRARGLPDWMVGQATRNRTRVSRFVVGSMATVAAAAAAWLEAAADDPVSGWRLGIVGLALGFNFVLFVVEGAGIAARRRLVAEMRARIERTPTERRGFEPAPV